MNVNIVAHTENVLTHLRVPAVSLVTEVNASFQQLAHCEIRQCHAYNS
jgi:hypothetical protein